MQHIRTFLLVVVFIFAFSGLYATNPPPINDTVCDAIDLGTLPVPGPCPGYPYGDTVHVDGTTNWATYNTFDFSPAHCFPSGSPDVWYKFRGTGNYIYIELFGFGDLDSMFVKLHVGQGSCLGLIPGHCETTFNGVIMASIYTPDIGGEYYLQIGGSQYDETGDFMFAIKSFNDCGDCVRNASVELTPAPWFGRYGTSDTVTMCTTIDRWDLTTTSKLHAVVPMFGDEWDTTSLVPVSYPATANGWIWGNNIPTPNGSLDGFYFDGNFDGDPTNNPGQGGNVTTSWEFCWSISTKPFCNNYDAHVDIWVYSDDQTGSGNSMVLCNEMIPMHLSMSGWCCPDPIVSVISSGVCASVSLITVDPVSVNSADSFNIVLYDDSLAVVGYQPNVTGNATFVANNPGDYLLEVYNVSTGCISFHSVHVAGTFEINLTQTVVGCGPGSGSVVATPQGNTTPYSYNWPGITTFTDSLAFGLDEGYVVVQITDGMGCTVEDSIYVTVLPSPGATFGYADISYCSNDDTIQVYYPPYTGGGTYSLISPTGAGITVDATTGTVFLNNSPLSPPYWVYVQYTVGSVCTASEIDSVQIVQQPAAPTPTSALSVDWCIGSPPPTHTIAVGVGIPFWYDPQTTASGFAYSMTPSLNASSLPGTYFYGFTFFSDFTGGCASVPTIFTVIARTPPVFTPSADVTICSGDTTTLWVSGSGPMAYSWSPAPTNSPNWGDTVYTAPPATTTYTINGTDGFCSSSGLVTVNVLNSADCGLTVYNGITPNGDGHNDSWVIDGADLVTNMTVCIYNRWGKMVWKGNNYNNTTVVWRGDSLQGEPLPSGTYFYTLDMDNHDSSTGWIELTR